MASRDRLRTRARVEAEGISKDRRTTVGLLSITAVADIPFFGPSILGWGGLVAFFSHPARAGAFGVITPASVAALFSGINLDGCVRADARDRWMLAPLIVIGEGISPVPALDDRRDLLRVGPMFVPGRRFTRPLASQEEHALITRGFSGTAWG